MNILTNKSLEIETIVDKLETFLYLESIKNDWLSGEVMMVYVRLGLFCGDDPPGGLSSILDQTVRPHGANLTDL